MYAIMTAILWKSHRILPHSSLNLKEFEEKITPKTRAVIVNTPHNPTGVVYSEETIRKLASILEAKQKEFGTVIYLISDEPYRELAYDGVQVPYLTKYYANTIVGYPTANPFLFQVSVSVIWLFQTRQTEARN